MSARGAAANGGDLEQARACYAQHRWAEALEAFQRAERRGPIPNDDLDRLAWAAALVGNDDAFLRALGRLHDKAVRARDRRLAARAAFWSGFRLLSVGSISEARGWLARAQRHLEGEDDGCPERGYLLLPEVMRHLRESDDVEAAALAERAATLGRDGNDLDLAAIAGNLQGRALLRQGRVAAGLAILDETFLAVTSGDVSPFVRGLVCCSAIDTCRHMSVLDRAREWTSALARWCDGQPQLVTFTGICIVRQAEVMQLGGEWVEAAEQIRQVCEHADEVGDEEVLGEAWYQRAELCRLRGDLVQAEAAYREASQHGCQPQPGLALLRRAQGRSEEAASAIGRVLHTTSPAWKRARLLPAYVEIALAAGRVEDARAAADELESMARTLDTDVLRATAAQARGALRIVEGETEAAVEPLQQAFDVWHRLGAPHMSARVRMLLGSAYRALGDGDGARLELDAARRAFARLGASLDLAALDAVEQAVTAPSHGLSPRELEVLRLVASGRTNKLIARELGLSDRTVDRHVSNIFDKLDVPSRAAATAFAYRHHLV